ncbi:hypothetical protein NEOLEDRAFT_1151753 [Neolentinus lepideus HHB14362 ss-1]|uniref:Protein phosphatase methylesterase 1 n=1 Tax=Neolentinus lepideus HHB14362 ss-1 TaxID=1314782 RepID=A0A165NKI6_9AGAM|nr:hypothetical protein NEOLEDRAFT_1151753 [Neolentinus lepideus HHB14362 ss-1]
MSDLYRSALQARISNLPPLPPHPDPDPDDDDDEEARSSLGPMGPPFPPRYTKPAVPKAPNPAFSPLSAAPYFASASQVAVPPRHLDFRVYYTPPVSSGAVLVCHHGAGFSALSFACLAKEVQDMTAGKLGVLAVDARRHGKTVPMDGASDEDLSISVLTDDLTELLKTVFPDAKAAPELLLVGHSMGGAVVVHACPQLIDAGYSVLGVVVLDVVEGTALEALPYMNQILNARPDGFDSIEEAVEWHIKANQIHNPTSARISVPAIIVPTIIVPTTSSQSNTSASPSTPTSSSLSASSPLNSSSSSPSLSNASSSPSSPKKYTWRTALRSTGPYWESKHSFFLSRVSSR